MGLRLAYPHGHVPRPRWLLRRLVRAQGGTMTRLRPPGLHPLAINLTGRVFGRLRVLAPAGTNGRNALWLCRCTCGAEARVDNRSLRRGNTRSCGCLRREMARTSKTRRARVGCAWCGQRTARVGVLDEEGDPICDDCRALPATGGRAA